MALSEAFAAHLSGGVTTVARAWSVVRSDGVAFGFTDHDRALDFDGLTFKPETGMTARAVVQSTGLSIDNSEALGVLSDAAVTEEDIRAGRFDGAEVTAWLVNWADVAQRLVLFRGRIGEVRRGAGAFEAELEGLSEALNRAQGRVFQSQCSAVLGDAACRFDFALPGYVAERSVEEVEDATIFRFADFTGFDDRWFERGRFVVLSGAAKGLVGLVKNDRLSGTERVIELWQGLRAGIAPGDMVRIEAGCDKRAETCRLKFDNLLNFRGFPDIPGEDWLMSYPRSTSSGTASTTGGGTANDRGGA